MTGRRTRVVRLRSVTTPVSSAVYRATFRFVAGSLLLSSARPRATIFPWRVRRRRPTGVRVSSYCRNHAPLPSPLPSPVMMRGLEACVAGRQRRRPVDRPLPCIETSVADGGGSSPIDRYGGFDGRFYCRPAFFDTARF
jgi:hypothetical protein